MQRTARTVTTLLALLALTLASAQEPIRIDYWRSLSGALGQLQEDLVERFNASQDDVVVVSEFQGNYTEHGQKFMAALAANDVPETGLHGGYQVLAFGRSGVLEPLDPLIDGPNGVDRDDFVGPLLAMGDVGGQTYMIPFAVSTPLMYYNLDMLREAGFDGPPADWDAFVETVIGVSDHFGPGVFGFSTSLSTWALQSHIWGVGGQLSNNDFELFLDSPEVVDVLTIHRDLMHEHGAARLAPTDAGGVLGDFVNQRAAIIFASTANVASYTEQTAGAFELGVAMMPAGPEGRFVSLGGSGILIPAGLDDAQREAAWAFVRFMTSPESNAYLAENSGYLTYRLSAREFLMDFLAANPNYGVAFDQLQYARRTDLVNTSPEGEALLREALERIYVAGDDPATLMPQVQTQIEAALRREGLR